MRLSASVRTRDRTPDPLPPQLPDPAPCGTHAVQLLRTYPVAHGRGYPFARGGERSIARAYTKALGRARSLVYVEDQYLWSTKMVDGVFAEALRGRRSCAWSS